MAYAKMLKGRSKVGIIFSGGPAPAANAVISAAVLSFLDGGVPTIGFIGGYKNLINFDKNKPKLKENVHYKILDKDIGEIRNRRGIIIETARANPGKQIKKPDDLKDTSKTNLIQNVLDAFEMLDIGLLISIGGDDTLRTANLMNTMGIPTIHIPKTIDNDYFGITWTFGFWSSVDVIQKLIINLNADAKATSSYFIAEIMGRKAGWLTYAAGIAGGAVKMIALEDLPPEGDIDVDAVCEDIVDSILVREKEGRPYGVVCIAEGLADRLPDYLKPTEKDPFGHIVLANAEIGKVISKGVERFYKEKTGNAIKLRTKQLGYEARTSPPISFDVVLASMLGHGAFRLFSEGKVGHMVSVKDNFDIISIPFNDLIDPVTLTTKVRTVPKDMDLYKLKNALSYKPI